MILAERNIKLFFVRRPVLLALEVSSVARKNDTKTLTVLSIEAELASLLAISSGKTILVEPLDYNKSKRAKSKSDIRIYRVLNKPRATRSLSRHLLVTKYPLFYLRIT